MFTTAKVGKKKLMFNLDPTCYTDREAYDELVRATEPPNTRFPELTHHEAIEKWEKEKRKDHQPLQQRKGTE